MVTVDNPGAMVESTVVSIPRRYGHRETFEWGFLTKVIPGLEERPLEWWDFEDWRDQRSVSVTRASA